MLSRCFSKLLLSICCQLVISISYNTCNVIIKYTYEEINPMKLLEYEWTYLFWLSDRTMRCFKDTNSSQAMEVSDKRLLSRSSFYTRRNITENKIL